VKNQQRLKFGIFGLRFLGFFLKMPLEKNVKSHVLLDFQK